MTRPSVGEATGDSLETLLLGCVRDNNLPNPWLLLNSDSEDAASPWSHTISKIFYQQHVMSPVLEPDSPQAIIYEIRGPFCPCPSCSPARGPPCPVARGGAGERGCRTEYSKPFQYTTSGAFWYNWYSRPGITLFLAHFKNHYPRCQKHISWHY